MSRNSWSFSLPGVMTGAVTGVISTPPSHSKFLYNSNELCRDGVHLITPTIFLSHKNPFNNIDEGGSEFCGEFFYKPSYIFKWPDV